MKKFFFLFLIAATTIISCEQNKVTTLSASDETAIDTASSSCPFLTRDNKGNIVLSWVRKTDNSNALFCYAISTDGKTFGKTIQIPSSTSIHAHAENLPKLIFKPSGEIIAVWGAANPNPENSYSGLVYYSRSFDDGKSWSKATRLVKDTSGYDQRYFDVALLPDGEAAIIWLDNRKKTIKEGSALYYATTNKNDGFINEKLISEPCCECCRTKLFIDSKKNIHTLYRAILNDSIRDMVHAVSTDGGNSFSSPVKISNDNWVINGCPHTGPTMAENKNGLHFAWFTAGTGTGVFYNKSTDNGNTFSAKDSLSSRSGRHPQVQKMPDGDIAITWDESFANGSSYNSRIGIQIRNAEGKEILKDFVTTINGSATYPVLLPLNSNSFLVAYTGSNKDKSNVFYKTVTVR